MSGFASKARPEIEGREAQGTESAQIDAGLEPVAPAGYLGPRTPAGDSNAVLSGLALLPLELGPGNFEVRGWSAYAGAASAPTPNTVGVGLYLVDRLIRAGWSARLLVSASLTMDDSIAHRWVDFPRPVLVRPSRGVYMLGVWSDGARITRQLYSAPPALVSSGAAELPASAGTLAGVDEEVTIGAVSTPAPAVLLGTILARRLYG